MRIPLLIAASLLATACDSPGSDAKMAASGVGEAQNDADSALTEEAPTSLAFVQAAAMSNLYEIATANIALDKAEAGSVRDFAQMMVTDHSKALETLEDAVGSSGQTLALPINLDADHQAKVDILQSLQGAAFDREYLSQQMTAHREALTLLKAYGGEGEIAELRQFAQGAIPTVQKHHDWLEKNTPQPGTAMASGQATPTP
jgi:putative membrane protein